ncbi:MAG: acyl carrier protein [Terriglobales bacterium]|jgi:acyl carrier protein|nr:acyl carrier protein [Terriglobales bacterium]
MDDNQERLARCFLAVFPRLAKADVLQASQTSVSGWDSVATVTLLTTVEEEFGIQVDLENLDQLTSFDSILRYVKGALGQ